MSKRIISKLPYNFYSLKGADLLNKGGLIPTSVYK